MSVFRKALTVQPGYADTYFFLAEAYADRGRLDEAIGYYRQALKIDPHSAKTLNNLGLALKRQGRLDEAIKYYHKATAVKPVYPGTFSNIGVALEAKGQFDKAEEAYRRAIALDPNLVIGYANLGNLLTVLGRADEAVSPCRRAVALAPELAGARLNLGLALYESYRFKEAIPVLQKAIALDPANPTPYISLGECYRLTAQFPEAVQILKRGQAIGSKKPDWRFPAMLQAAERMVVVDTRLDTFLAGKQKPQSADDWLALAHVCQARQHHRAAARAFAAAFAARAALERDLNAGHRFDAACAAARAGTAQGKDADKLDTKERARWRNRALAWLRADLAIYSRLLAAGRPEIGREVRRALRRWPRDPDFADLRTPAALARLPSDEQQSWRKFWADIEALLRK
jgi:Tfp pilus assembly protein PilF